MSKRKQVKNACVNCQKACKKCDDARPCDRCIKYGLEDSCRDSARKERRRSSKKGGSGSYGSVDGETDYSDDDMSSVAFSEGHHAFSQKSPPPISLKFKIQDPKGKSKGGVPGGDHGAYWNVHDNRPVRSARQRAITYDEERLIQQAYQQQMSSRQLHIGAPDASFIKALGLVCTENLRKLEEEDLPPAVTFQEWPPKSDQHFEQVSFDAVRRTNTIAMTTDQYSMSVLKQPLPVQRIILPEILQPIQDSTSTSCGSSNIAPSSSPVEQDLRSGMKPKPAIMTPPETPVNTASFGEGKKLGTVQLPTIQELKESLSGCNLDGPTNNS